MISACPVLFGFFTLIFIPHIFKEDPFIALFHIFVIIVDFNDKFAAMARLFLVNIGVTQE
jgi:hypothetical protein